MATWFTSDTHFGYPKILDLAARPFVSIEAMDAKLLQNWNALVGDDDDVWHLGNFSTKAGAGVDDILPRLNGRKHLVWGNHDRDVTRGAPHWASAQPYAEFKLDGILLCLLHFGMRVWRRSEKGSIHLYGHSRGALPGDNQSCDVGVDVPAWSFAPVEWSQVRAMLSANPARIEPVPRPQALQPAA